MKVIFAAGGTGGHVFPAVAIAEALARRQAGVVSRFVLGAGGKGARFLEASGHAWDAIPMKGMPRRNPLLLVPFAWNLARSLFASIGVLRRERPDAVVAMGGYPSAPVSLAAAILRLPVYVAEQNRAPGLATKWNARFARRIFLAFEGSRGYFPASKDCVVTGNPVRPSIFDCDRARAHARWDLDPQRRTVLFVGGSQGARTMNAIVLECLSRWERTEEVQFLFQTGVDDYESFRQSCSRIRATVRTVPFLAEMGDAYGVATVVVGRAGASTLAELTALGKASILVPYPWAAEGHQSGNARYMEQSGAAVRIEQSDLTAETLGAALHDVLFDDAKRHAMEHASRTLGRPDAADAIADGILDANRQRGERLIEDDTNGRSRLRSKG